MMLKLDEMQPIHESVATLIARAIVNAHGEAAKLKHAELDDIRKQQHRYFTIMLQRARWYKAAKEEGER